MTILNGNYNGMDNLSQIRLVKVRIYRSVNQVNQSKKQHDQEKFNTSMKLHLSQIIEHQSYGSQIRNPSEMTLIFVKIH